jgi:hypothetical protein
MKTEQVMLCAVSARTALDLIAEYGVALRPVEDRGSAAQTQWHPLESPDAGPRPCDDCGTQVLFRCSRLLTMAHRVWPKAPVWSQKSISAQYSCSPHATCLSASTGGT